MAIGTIMVFKDEALQARSVQLNLTTSSKTAAAKQTPKAEEKGSEGDQDSVTTLM